MGFQIYTVVLLRLRVFSLIVQHLGIAQIDNRVLVFISNGIFVTIERLGTIQYPVALSLLESYLALELALFFGVNATIHLFVYLCRVVVFANSIFLVRTLNARLETAGAQSRNQC